MNILVSIICLFILGNLFFFWSVSKKNYGLVDICWGLCFLSTAIVSFYFSSKELSHTLMLTAISLWSLRLSIYLSIRNIGHSEDFRYQSMRKEWGERANLHAYFKVFLFQPVLSFIISLPFIMSFNTSKSPSAVELTIGSIVFLFGLIFETTADYTLYRFKKNSDNKGKILTTGVWSLSRHPNYFGEFVLWWGIFIMSGQLIHNPWTIVGPITISFFLLKVSGVPLLEERYKKDQAYREYADRTNSFFPWPKKRS